MTARLRAVTEATEAELLRTVASSLVTGSRPRSRLGAVARAGAEAAIIETGRLVADAHLSEALGAQPGEGLIELQRRTRRRIERAFEAVLVDATRLHDRLAQRDLDPAATQVELDRAARFREGCRVNVQGRWWTLTTYCLTVAGSATKRAGIWGRLDRG